jgi:hypothetical protein
MEKFVLKTIEGEIINMTTQKNIDSAIEYFSEVKKLPKKELIKIFKIEKDESRNND